MLRDVVRVSSSSQADHVFVIHIDRKEKDKDKSKKGDYMLVSEHVIEIITRMFIAYRKALNSELSITISDSFLVNLDAKGGTRVTFDRGVTPVEEVQHRL